MYRLTSSDAVPEHVRNWPGSSISLREVVDRLGQTILSRSDLVARIRFETRRLGTRVGDGGGESDNRGRPARSRPSRRPSQGRGGSSRWRRRWQPPEDRGRGSLARVLRMRWRPDTKSTSSGSPARSCGRGGRGRPSTVGSTNPVSESYRSAPLDPSMFSTVLDERNLGPCSDARAAKSASMSDVMTARVAGSIGLERMSSRIRPQRARRRAGC